MCIIFLTPLYHYFSVLVNSIDIMDAETKHLEIRGPSDVYFFESLVFQVRGFMDYKYMYLLRVFTRKRIFDASNVQPTL